MRRPIVNSILRKIGRDLTQRKGRTLLTLTGLWIGLWGVGSVAVAWLVLQHDLDANFLSAVPPAIVLDLDGRLNVDPAALEDIEGVDRIENRPLLMARVEVAPESRLPLTLFVVDDFGDMGVSRVFGETGSLPPPTGSLVLERDGLLLARFTRLRAAAVASGGNPHASPVTAPTGAFEDAPVAIRLPGGRSVTAPVSGTVFDPYQAPSRTEQAFYGYVTRDTATQWTGGNYDDRLLITTAAGYGDEAAVAATAARVQSRLAGLGATVTRSEFPSTTEHVHQFQMNSILFLLAGLGVLALLMSVVLVSNLINGILTGQIRQIGTLKAMGASTRQVELIFLGAMGLLGLVASLAALPWALRSGLYVSRVLAANLNFDLYTLQFPLALSALFVALGSLFPVLAALPSVRRWSRVPVTEALRHFGARADAGSGSTLGRILGPLPVNLRMGLRNAFRAPARTALTAGTLALGVVIFLSAMNMRSSLLLTAESEETQKRFDVAVRFEHRIDPQRVVWMERFPIVARAETWRVQAASVVDTQRLGPERVPLLLVPEDSEIIRPKMLEGQWLGGERAGGVVINHRLQNEYPRLAVGGEVTVAVDDRRLTLPVVGVMKEFSGAAIYIRDADYRALDPTLDARVNVGFVTLEEPNEQNLAELTRLLESHFELAQVGVLDIRSAKIASRVIRGHLDVIVQALLIVALLMLAVSSLGMASAMSTSVVERTRELGVLRAIGARVGAIFALLASEAVAIALLAWLGALLLAQPVSRRLTTYFGNALVEYPFDYLTSWAGLGWSLLIAVAVACLATLTPARLVVRQSVRDAVGYE